MATLLDFVGPDRASFLIGFLAVGVGFFVFEALSEALIRVIFVPTFDDDGFATIL